MESSNNVLFTMTSVSVKKLEKTIILLGEEKNLKA